MSPVSIFPLFPKLLTFKADVSAGVTTVPPTFDSVLTVVGFSEALKLTLPNGVLEASKFLLENGLFSSLLV